MPRKSKLRIGLWVEDAALPVFPPAARTLREAATALKAAGHDIIPIHNPAPLSEAGAIFALANKLDPNNSVFQILLDGQESPLPALVDIEKELPLENREYNLADLWKFNGDREDYRKSWHKVWAENDIDILLCPGARGTAVPHGKFGVPWYTMIWNLLNMSELIPSLYHRGCSSISNILIIYLLVSRFCHSLLES